VPHRRGQISCGRAQPADAQQVVRGGGEVQKLGIALNAAQAGLTKTSDRFPPTDELFDGCLFGMPQWAKFTPFSAAC
jgi:hypothetical protein